MNIEELSYHEEPDEAMNHIVLFQPQIPQNTGNVARTCAATNAPLYIIRLTGLPIDDRKIKHVGLGYWDKPDVTLYDSLGEFMEKCDDRVHLISELANKVYSDENYNDGKHHYFLFGREDKGLPEEFMRANPEETLRIPMNDEYVRSLNLSDIVYVIVHGVPHQQVFPNLELSHTCAHNKLK